jgi:hypothetical protein
MERPKRSTSKTWTYEEKPFCPKVEVYEKSRSKEEFDNVPEVYAWLLLDEERQRHYRGQHVYDVIHQLACEEHCEQVAYQTFEIGWHPSVGESPVDVPHKPLQELRSLQVEFIGERKKQLRQPGCIKCVTEFRKAYAGF